jgi:hypothetical protein
MKTITQVAGELGVRHWNIRHAFDGGYVERPTIFSGRFVFTPQDVENLRIYFTRKETHDDASCNELAPE